MQAGEALRKDGIDADQHFTEPPPRYTEEALIKRMEDLGIGRPSTYASTLAVLKDREYVRIEKRRLVPEDKGRLVTAFLESFFNRWVDYDFTAKSRRAARSGFEPRNRLASGAAGFLA